ncbi:hypothetical protein PHLGIDRAFT_129793 [Phlebiopsis gigantea 11061_1 CR5-6]|uniref:Uncharacterized protein n=1 Tax=Phlebiopsis gigantea (strain 11061_1 CR5-6) TaxID=745531 RepID=A0A0C3PES8_PHLG1|nr:hypothetical protein PHLGIDRAFT_129793 [Phlebiopsis gigantea 11061_1 CR5-6]
MDDLVNFRLQGQAPVQTVSLQQLLQALTARIARKVEYIEIVLRSMGCLPNLALVDLADFQNLQTVRVTISFNPGSEAQAHVSLWKAIEQLVLSVPSSAPLQSLELEGVFPHSLVGRGWSRSPIVVALRRPLHSFATRLAALIDNRRGTVITIKPPAPSIFHTESERKRIESLLEALAIADLLRY